MDGKSPLLSDYERIYQKEDLDRILRAQSSLSAKTSLPKQPTGELSIGHGCSLTQTVFNGKLCYSSVLLLIYILLPMEKFLIYVKRYQITNVHHLKRMKNLRQKHSGVSTYICFSFMLTRYQESKGSTLSNNLTY